MQLRARPIPFEGESRRGYYWRLATINGFDSPGSMVRIVGTYYKDPLSIESLIKQNLSPQNSQRILSVNDRCSTQFILKRHFRYCPACMAELSYLRESWDYALLPYCHVHDVRLKSAKANPSKLLGLKSGRFLVSQARVTGLPGFQLQKVLEHKLGISTDPDFCLFSALNDLSADELQRLILLVGSYLSHADRHQPRKIPIKADIRLAASVMQSAAQVLLNFPNNIGILIKRLIRDEPTNRQVGRAIGYIYRAIHKELKDPCFGSFVEAFDQALACEWPELIDKRNQRLYNRVKDQPRYISGTELRKKLGISINVLVHFVETGQINGHIRKLRSGKRQITVPADQEAKLVELLQGLSLQEASRQLGLPRTCLRELLHNGIIAGDPPVPGSRWFIQPRALAAFFQRIKAVAKPGKVGRQDCSLNRLARFYLSCTQSMASVILAVLEGELACKCGGCAPNHLSELIFIDRQDFQDWSCNPGELTVQDMAKALRVKQDVAYHLVNRKLILTRGRGRLGRFATQRQIDVFNARYIWAREISRQCGRSPRAVIRLLNRFHIQPVSEPSMDGGRQYLYRRKDLSQEVEKGLHSV